MVFQTFPEGKPEGTWKVGRKRNETKRNETQTMIPVTVFYSSLSYIVVAVPACLHAGVPPSVIIIHGVSHNGCRYGTRPSFSCMISSLRRHRFSPSSSSCAWFEGAVTLRSGTILNLFLVRRDGWVLDGEGGRERLTYCPWIPSLTMSSLVAANRAGRHPSSTGSFMNGFMLLTPTLASVP